MAGFDGDKRSATRRADFAFRRQFRFDNGSIVSRFDDSGSQSQGSVGWGRAQQLNRVVSRDGAGRRLRFVTIHQMPTGRPV